jgi:hypothetical protein
VERSTAFYCDVLGAKLLSAARPVSAFAARRAIIRTGSCLIDLNEFDANGGDSCGLGVVRLSSAIP